jgi:hypothetical protein
MAALARAAFLLAEGDRDMDIPDTAADRHGAEDHSSCGDIAYLRVRALVSEGYDLTAIAAHDGLPSADTLRRWLTERDDFRAHYERSRPAREDKWTADIVALVDSLAGEKRSGVRLRVEARKWRLAMLRKDALKATAKVGDKTGEKSAAQPGGTAVDDETRARWRAILEGRFEEYIESLNAKR